MKKTLLLLGFVLATIAANAQTLFGTPLSNNTTQKERMLKAPSKAALHKLSVPKDEKPVYNPERDRQRPGRLSRRRLRQGRLLR